MSAAYPIWLILFFLGPTVLLWALCYRLFWRYRLVFAKLIALSVLSGVLWDTFAIKFNLWTWPKTCCVLPRLFALPLEEIVFMVLAAVLIVALTILMRGWLPPERRP